MPAWKSLVALAACVAFAGTLFSAPVSASGGERGRPMAADDGLWWSDDIQISNDPSIDQMPQVSVDANGNSRVLWYRGGNLVYFMKLDRTGNPLTGAKNVASALPAQNGFFYGDRTVPALDIDSRENVWVLSGQWPPSVSTYDTNGNPIATNAAVSRGGMPHAPGGIRVSTEDYGYLIYERYDSGGAPPAFTKMKVDGTRVVDGTPVDNLTTYSAGLKFSVDRYNYLHTLFNASSSSVGEGFILATLDKYGAKSAPLGKLNISNPGSLPAMANDRAGSTHMVWPSSPNGGTLRYLKAAFDNSAVNDQSGGVTVSTTTTGRPFVTTDSGKNAYIFWADTRNGPAEIYYMKVKPGLENSSDINRGKWKDSGVPVRLTFHQGGGQARNPWAAVDPEDDLHVVWEDDRTGNWEIWYKFAFPFGVVLSMPPSEMEKELYVRPNELKTAYFTVRNTGILPDRALLNLSVNFYGKLGATGQDNRTTKGWWVDIGNYTLDLNGQESRKVNGWVRGPVSGKDHDYIDITITAKSDGVREKTSTLRFRTYLIQRVPMFIMKAPLNIGETACGESVTYGITLQNTGSEVEEVLLTNQSPPGWKAALDRNRVVLGPVGEAYSTARVNLTVTAPVTAKYGEQGIVTVTGRLAAQQSMKSTIVTHTLVAGCMYLVMDAPDREHWIDPGASTIYQIRVANYGNMAGTIPFMLGIVTETGAWDATLSTSIVALRGGETTSVNLTVKAPPNARAGEQLVVKVKGYNEKRTQTQEASVDLTTHVNAVHCLNVARSPERQVVYPGDNASYRVTVTNCGNSQNNVTVIAGEYPRGWAVEYPDASSPVSRLVLESNESRSFAVLLGIPPRTPAGYYKGTFRFLDSGGNTWETPIGVGVRQVFSTVASSGSWKMVGSPGRVALSTIEVNNNGNGPDNISLRVEGLPEGWKWEFRDTGLNPVRGFAVGPYSATSVSLLVTVPPDANRTSVEFTVLGISDAPADGTAVVGELNFTLDVLMPDLEIGSVAMQPPIPDAGKVVTLNVVVRNTGPVNAENVTVTFYDGKVRVWEERLVRLPAGANKTVTFTWLPGAGKHVLVFVVDREDTIIESRGDNNRWSRWVDVAGHTPDIMPGLAVVLAVTVLVSAAAAALKRLRRTV